MARLSQPAEAAPLEDEGADSGLYRSPFRCDRTENPNWGL